MMSVLLACLWPSHRCRCCCCGVVGWPSLRGVWPCVGREGGAIVSRCCVWCVSLWVLCVSTDNYCAPPTHLLPANILVFFAGIKKLNFSLPLQRTETPQKKTTLSFFLDYSSQPEFNKTDELQAVRHVYSEFYYTTNIIRVQSSRTWFGRDLAISLSIFLTIPSKIVPQHKGQTLTFFN